MIPLHSIGRFWHTQTRFGNMLETWNHHANVANPVWGSFLLSLKREILATKSLDLQIGSTNAMGTNREYGHRPSSWQPASIPTPVTPIFGGRIERVGPHLRWKKTRWTPITQEKWFRRKPLLISGAYNELWRSLRLFTSDFHWSCDLLCFF